MKKNIEERIKDFIDTVLQPRPTDEEKETVVQKFLPLYLKKGLSEDYLRGIFDGVQFVFDRVRGTIE